MKYLLALHIISVIAWFAGLFYLPRIFVYHAMSDEKSVHEQFKVMEFKLYNYIMHPAAVLTLVSGFMLMDGYKIHHHWLTMKLILVVFLLAYHFLCGFYLDRFAKDKNQHSHKFFRFFNEVPTILLILIVILVVVRPF